MGAYSVQTSPVSGVSIPSCVRANTISDVSVLQCEETNPTLEVRNLRSEHVVPVLGVSVQDEMTHFSDVTCILEILITLFEVAGGGGLEQNRKWGGWLF